MNARAIFMVVTWLATVTLGCREPHGVPERARHDFERMRVQQRYDAYGRSTFFPNGAVMQAPPAHTVARDDGFASLGAVAPVEFLTGKARGAYVTNIPTTVDDRMLAAGARQFAISCALCHGSGGFGGGPMAPNLVQKRPPSLRSLPVSALAVGQVFDVITNGFGNMPPYGWQMPVATRWTVVAYERSLTQQRPTSETTADSARAMFLHRIDSLRAAGDDVGVMARAARDRP